MKYKRIAVVVAVILTSVLMWWAARAWLDQPAPFTDWRAMLFPALVAVLYGAVCGVALMLLDRWPERCAAMLGSWATFGIFWPGNAYYLSALPVFALAWFVASVHIKNDLADRRKVRVSATLAPGMKYILLAAFLMVSLGFYFTPHAQESSVASLSHSVQVQVRQEFSVNAEQIIRTWLKPVSRWVPPILALALFVVLWSLNFIFREPAIWLGTGLFWLLHRIGFVRIEKKQIEFEVLSL